MRARDGKVLWERPLPGRSETSPVVFGKSVIVGSESGDVFALDARDGEGRVAGLHRRQRQGRAGARRRGPLRRQLRRRGVRDPRLERRVRLAVEHPGAQLRPRRARLLDAGGRLRPRLPRQHRRSRLQLRRRQRRAALEPLDRRLGLPGPRGRRHQAHRARPSTSARRTRTSTRSTPRPARFAGRRTSAGSCSAPPACSARSSTSPDSARTSAPSASTSRPASRCSSHELGEYNPVISDGERLYLTGSSGIRAFEHETEAERTPSRRSRARSASASSKRRARGQRKRQGAMKAGGNGRRAPRAQRADNRRHRLESVADRDPRLPHRLASPRRS